MKGPLRYLSWVLLVCLSLYSSTPAGAQTAPGYRWLASGGGTGFDGGDNIAADAAGNVYATGIFSGTATFGSVTLTSQGDTDVYLAKYNPQGQLLWIRPAGGPGTDTVFDLAVDDAGNAWITGYFSSAADDPSLNPLASMIVSTVTLIGGNPFSELFLVKYSPQGALQWARQTVGPAVSTAVKMSLDGLGNVYLIGATEQRTRFEQQYPLFTPGTTSGTFLAKYTPQGTLAWVQTGFGTLNGSAYEQVSVGAGGQMLVISYDWKIAPGHPAGGYQQTYLTNVDPAGRILWRKMLPGSDGAGTLQVRRVAVETGGNLLLACQFRGILHGGRNGPVFTAQGHQDVLLLLLSPQGDVLQGQSFSGDDPTHPDGVPGLALDAIGNRYLALTLPDARVLPPPGRIVGTTLLCLAPDGALRWKRSGPAAVEQLSLSPKGEVLLTGGSNYAESFDDYTLSAAGFSDAFIAKLASTLPPVALSTPNIITPNGDGLNETFRLPGLPTGPWELRIFSRWGTLVYHTADYRQDWTATGLPAGAYYYWLTAPGQTPLRGWVEVVR
ncbi:gliding motility-associated C-terminal domain-containing protein [Hymenobacter sediminis]|uniref:gliding motility-associated C-terminal domain-containing protein n=1 Tax=Hymenobacter sediminis TaxID=2218621 RepID=UPI000DA69365|nr:gliding motility-associated C-terminal domain-containing protein [Hymenobacter sediminis]RPD44112.1 gliding motility-associated C-terminal domain-containing protein [Hymenobacter sediminis]